MLVQTRLYYGSVKETKPWCEIACSERREERAQRRLTSSPTGKKLHYKSYRSTILQRTETKKKHSRRLQLNYDKKKKEKKKKEQTQWQDDGTVLALPPWAWCKAQCHEPNSTAEYFHQAPPDSPLTHWQDLGWPVDGACPFIQWSFIRIMCLSLVHIHSSFSICIKPLN